MLAAFALRTVALRTVEQLIVGLGKRKVILVLFPRIKVVVVVRDDLVGVLPQSTTVSTAAAAAAAAAHQITRRLTGMMSSSKNMPYSSSP